jgi:hypothetical protein
MGLGPRTALPLTCNYTSYSVGENVKMNKLAQDVVQNMEMNPQIPSTGCTAKRCGF